MRRVFKVVLPELGAYLVRVREGFRWKKAQAASIAARRGIAVSYQALRGIEEGTTQNPEPNLFRALADLYQVPYDELVRRYVKERYEVDLAPERVEQLLQAHLGGGTRLQEDESELIDTWRDATAEGRRTALTVLKACKGTKPGKKRRHA